MRTLFAVIIFTSTFSAIACPNLAGTYTSCIDQDGEVNYSEIVVTQKVVNRTTIYTITSPDEETGEMSTTTYRADGKTYTETEHNPDVGTIKMATTVSCNGSTSIRLKINVSLEGESISDINSEVTKRGNKMVTITKGQIFGQQINSTATCQ